MTFHHTITLLSPRIGVRMPGPPASRRGVELMSSSACMWFAKSVVGADGVERMWSWGGT